VGPQRGRRVRAGAAEAAALRHAVSLGQHGHPVDRLRRRGDLARRLRLLLHPGARRSRLPAGHLLHLRRRHGVGQRRPRAPGGLRRRASPGRGRPAAPDGPPGGSARPSTRTGTGSRRFCATPTSGCAASARPATRTPPAWSSPPTRSTPRSSPTGSGG
jgi:hypothetical protein